MKKILELLIRRRNKQFAFDPRLSGGMILSFLLGRCTEVLRGLRLLLAGRRPNGLMLGRGIHFSYLSRIRWGRFLRLGDHVSLSGLGHEGIILGNNVGIGAHSRIVVSTSLNEIGSHIRIGDNVGIGEFAYLGGAGGLEIGSDCIIGQYFSCHPENHRYDQQGIPIRRQGVHRKGISIGNNCWIGSKVTILDGVCIGDGCVIAAGAVVTRSIPPDSVARGVPARIVGHRSPLPAHAENPELSTQPSL